MRYRSIIIILVLTVISGGWWVKKSWSDSDFRMASVDEKGITLKSISWKRRMVNVMEIGPEVPVWIPKGMGWYKAGEIERILKMENKTSLLGEILFYNFGFNPDVGAESERSMGLVNYSRYLVTKNEMMFKQEEVNKSLIDSKEMLNEVLPRDFANEKVLKEDVRVSIYNWGQSNGLASFVANSLERAGVTVLGIDTASDGDKDKACLIKLGPETKNTETARLIKANFSECDLEIDEELGSGEVELFFGDKYSVMLNYPSFINYIQ